MRRFRSGRRGASGFTLLEAVVALVIFSMGAVALYGWLSSNLLTVERVEASRIRTAATLSALDVVRHVNPMANATGSREVGDMRFEWSSRALQPPRRSVNQTGIPGAFEVALYELDVRVMRAGVEIRDFKVRQVGYRYIGGSAADNDEV
jgi:general secretion pathway protein I